MTDKSKTSLQQIQSLLSKFAINEKDIDYSYSKDKKGYPVYVTHNQTKHICEDYESLVIVMYEISQCKN